jgi:hypothetical protein
MSELSKGKAALYFLTFSFLAFALGFFEFFTTISGDTATYAYYARQINQGGLLYGGLWQFKPPGLYYIFAFIIRIFPDHINTLRAALLASNAAAALFIYRSARLKAGQIASLTLTAFFLFVTNLSGYFNWDGPYPESFFPLFGAAGYYFWSRFEISAHKKYLFLAGTMAGCLISFKQTSVSFAAVCALSLIYNIFRKPSAVHVKEAFAFLMGCLWVPAVWIFYFASKGLGAKLMECLISYAIIYARSGNPVLVFVELLAASLFPLSIILIFSVKPFFEKKKMDGFLLLWLGIGLGIVYAPGRGFDRYMLEILVPLLFLCLQGLQAYFYRAKKPESRMIVLVLLYLLIIGLNQKPRMIYIIYSRIYKKQPVRSEVLKNYFHAKKDYKPSDSIFDWTETRNAYVSNMKSAISFLDLNSYAFSKSGKDVSPVNFDQVAEVWCKNPPRYFLDSRANSFLETSFATPKVKRFLKENYTPVSDLKLQGVDVYSVNPEITCQ